MNSAVYSLFISMALRVTVIICFIMLIKIILRKKLSAAAQCGIWLILVIQVLFCICNVSIPSELSIYNAVPDVSVSVQKSAEPDIRNVIAFIYSCGVLISAAWYLIAFIVNVYRTSGFEFVGGKDTEDIFEELIHKLGINRKITLRRGKIACTVMNMIVLPDGYTHDEQRQILLHELCHYKNKDNIKLMIAAAVICLNWFNPVVWIAFRRFRNDIEMYCDECVMKHTDSKKEYAKVLVKAATARSMFIPGVAGVSGGKHEVVRRVETIISWKKKKPAWLIAAVCACITVSCICLTDAVSTAVENTAEVTQTPEPIDTVPAVIEKVIPQSTTEPAQEKAAVYSASEKSVNETEEKIPVSRQTQTPYNASDSDIYSVPLQDNEEDHLSEETAENTGTAENDADNENAGSIEEVEYQDLGEPESVSANGNKETYSLDDGRTVIVHYDNGEPEKGYIINGDTGTEEIEDQTEETELPQ